MVLVLLFVALAGLFHLIGVPGFSGVDPSRQGSFAAGGNLDWDAIWEGTRIDANGIVTGLYNVIW